MSDQIRQIIQQVAEHAKSGNPFGLNVNAELETAYQIVVADHKKAEKAMEKPFYLHKAILNAIALGVTLSPHSKLGYIVIRQKVIQLDISYRGLIYLATSSGSIIVAKPELVYEGEEFAWNGSFSEPTHVFHPFKRKAGEDPFVGLLGGYSVAILPGGNVIADYMDLSEINKTRALSKADGATSPWIVWPRPMLLKTLLKRSTAYWPYSDRLAKAIDVLNEHEGMDFNEPAPASTPEPRLSAEQVAAIRGVLPAAKMSEAEFCGKAQIEDLGALNPSRFEGAMDSLKNRAEKAAAQQQKQVQL